MGRNDGNDGKQSRFGRGNGRGGRGRGRQVDLVLITKIDHLK